MLSLSGFSGTAIVVKVRTTVSVLGVVLGRVALIEMVVGETVAVGVAIVAEVVVVVTVVEMAVSGCRCSVGGGGDKFTS